MNLFYLKYLTCMGKFTNCLSTIKINCCFVTEEITKFKNVLYRSSHPKPINIMFFFNYNVLSNQEDLEKIYHWK